MKDNGNNNIFNNQVKTEDVYKNMNSTDISKSDIKEIIKLNFLNDLEVSKPKSEIKNEIMKIDSLKDLKDSEDSEPGSLNTIEIVKHENNME